jgi:hypothetical protein
LGTAALATAAALPVGRALARLAGWRRHVAAALAFLPVAAPPVALATGLQVALLSAGVGGTPVGVLLAHLVPAVGYLSLLFLGTFTLFDARVEEAARTLGAAPRPCCGASRCRCSGGRWRRRRRWGSSCRGRSSRSRSWWAAGAGAHAAAGGVRARARGEDAHAAAGALLLTVPAVLLLAALRLAAGRAEAVVA